MTLLHLIEQSQHRSELMRILHLTDPTPEMLHAAADRPGLAGGRSAMILMRHRAIAKKAKSRKSRGLLFGGRG